MNCGTAAAVLEGSSDEIMKISSDDSKRRSCLMERDVYTECRNRVRKPKKPGRLRFRKFARLEAVPTFLRLHQTE